MRGDWQVKLLANFIGLIHALWIFAVAAALPLMFFIERMKEYGLGMVGLNLATWAVWRRCPLSEWQARLLKKFHPPSAFDGAFINHYARKYFSFNLSRATWRKIVYAYMGAIVAVALLL